MQMRSLVPVVLAAVLLLVSVGTTPVPACSLLGGDPGAAPVLQQEPRHDPVLDGMLAQVDASELHRTVSDLQAFSTRVYPSAGNRRAAAYLHDRLDAIEGLEVNYQGDELQNVVATLPGTGPDAGAIVVVGAHYDSISDDPGDAPGATDNAGGAAIVLELARVMSQYRYNRTVQFAFWNAEESGLDGSADYVRSASDRSLRIPLYLNIDSGCYDPNDEYVLDLMYDDDAAPFAALMERYNAEYGIGFDLTFNKHRCGSDHVSFRKGGYPAIATHAQEHAPEVHTPGDTIELVSMGYAHKNARLGLLLLAGTAELRPPAIPAPVVTAPPAGVPASPVVSAPPPPVPVPTVAPATPPGFAFGARRYVIGSVPRSPREGAGGGVGLRGVSVGVRSPAIGAGIASGTAPPSGRFVRWSPLARWRLDRTA